MSLLDPRGSTDYRELIEGRVTSEEYVRRLLRTRGSIQRAKLRPMPSALDRLRERLDAAAEEQNATVSIDLNVHTESMWSATVAITANEQEWPERGHTFTTGGAQSPEAALTPTVDAALAWLNSIA